MVNPDKLNEAWKSTTKIIIGHELGDLEEYEKYLSNICLLKVDIQNTNIDLWITTE